jgi:hypothetical protein
MRQRWGLSLCALRTNDNGYLARSPLGTPWNLK